MVNKNEENMSKLERLGNSFNELSKGKKYTTSDKWVFVAYNEEIAKKICIKNKKLLNIFSYIGLNKGLEDLEKEDLEKVNNTIDDYFVMIKNVNEHYTSKLRQKDVTNFLKKYSYNIYGESLNSENYSFEIKLFKPIIKDNKEVKENISDFELVWKDLHTVHEYEKWRT